MMLASNIPIVLLFLLSTGRMTTQAAQPNCTDIADFENCGGDTAGFCPKGIACGCKEEMPFCKCPSYRVKWENYWYMGPKCDQLWSTLDLIIISSLPALALASVAVVSVQWIYYCYTKPKKRTRNLGSPPIQVIAQAEPIPQYVTKLADEPRYVIPQQGVKNSGPGPNFKFPQISLQYQLDTDVHSSPSYVPSQPLRKVTSLSGSAYGNPSTSVQPFSYWGGKMPAVDYEEENPFTNMAMQQLANLSTPAFPLASYDSPQVVNYRNAERGGHPFKFVQPQKAISGF